MGSLTHVEEHNEAESVKPQFRSVTYFKDLLFLTLLLNVFNHYSSEKVSQQISGIRKESQGSQFILFYKLVFLPLIIIYSLIMN